MSDLEPILIAINNLAQKIDGLVESCHNRRTDCDQILIPLKNHLEEVKVKKKSVKIAGNGGNGGGKISLPDGLRL